MKFGLTFANSWPFNTADAAVELAGAAEAVGFESLWTLEHVVWPESYESEYPYSRSGKMPGDPAASIPDPLIWLSWVGARTSRIRLGTGILILPQRNPLVVAKALATLDDLSGGRAEAGIGVGWLREEFDALGVPFERRGARTDEYIDAMRAVWSRQSARFSGEFVNFEGVNVNPKPVNQSIPITIGGHSVAAARRAGRTGNGFMPGRAIPEELTSLFDEVRRTAEEHDRDPESIILSAGHRLGIGEEAGRGIEELAALGVTRMVVPAFLLLRPDLDTAMGRMAELIAAYS
jgi:probable F420-dependent oxidoreductase